jgi:hypothetical protein
MCNENTDGFDYITTWHFNLQNRLSENLPKLAIAVKALMISAGHLANVKLSHARPVSTSGIR